MEQDLEIIPQLQSVVQREREGLRQVKADLIVPLKARPGQLSGVLILGQRPSGKNYTIEEKQLIYALSNQIAVSLENSRMYDDALKTRRTKMVKVA